MMNASFMAGTFHLCKAWQNGTEDKSRRWPRATHGKLAISLVRSVLLSQPRWKRWNKCGNHKCFPGRGTTPKFCRFGFSVVSRSSGAASGGPCRHHGRRGPDRLFRAVPAPVSARRSFCDLLWDDVSDPRRELRWSLSKPGFYLVHG